MQKINPPDLKTKRKEKAAAFQVSVLSELMGECKDDPPAGERLGAALRASLAAVISSESLDSDTAALLSEYVDLLLEETGKALK